MADRQIANTREPIAPRGTPTVQTGSNTTNRTSLLETRGNTSGRTVASYETRAPQSIPDWADKVTGIRFSDVYKPIDEATGASPTGAGTTPAYQPLYAIDNPFGIAADLFSRFYGGAPTESPQSPVVVGDAAFATQGGSNAGLFVILAIVGIVGYFLYKRYAK